MYKTRRQFLAETLVVAAGSALPLSAISAMRGRVSANDRIQIGLIGANGMGFANLKSMLIDSACTCVAICDVDENVYNKRAAELVESGFPKPVFYNDHRRMLEDKEIDVVIIGTPDHWHCLQLIDSLEADKHVYLEKPIGNTIEEIDVMVKAVKKHNKMVQVGQWQRSQPHFLEAIKYLHAKKLGRIRTVRTWISLDWKGAVPPVADSPVPSGVDYTSWLGPATKRPFNSNRFHFSFRWYWDYAGGLMTDWGVHLIDYVLYAMKVAEPKSVVAMGGKLAFPDDDMQTPDTMHALYDFGHFTMTWEQTIGIASGHYGRTHGISFVGEKGTLILNRQGWEVIPEKGLISGVPYVKSEGRGLELHTENFLTCLKNNTPDKLNADITVGRNVALVAQMGNIAYRTGEKLDWLSSEYRFKQKAANKLLKANYQNGYTLPK